MQVAEFDRFADRYTEIHRRNLEVSGETPEYFTRYKIETLRARWSALRAGREPLDILDFGCGVGASLPHLIERFPSSRVAGLDVSTRSLAVARTRVPASVALHPYDGRTVPLEPASQDLIFSACVFHHIEPEARSDLLAQLHRLLRPGGALVVYEHNPLNPVTRYIVATCPFDANARLLAPWELSGRQRDVGFRRVRTAYTGFFPARLASLRRFERALSRVPLGAQYYTFAEI